MVAWEDPRIPRGIDIVPHTANLLGACGEDFHAGQIIITGSITPPLWAMPGEEIAFELPPIGAISIRFAAQPAQSL